jgi:hypothetical protein
MNYLGFLSKSDQDSSKKIESKSTDGQNNNQNSLKGSFESLGSVDLGFSASKKCYICNKNFNFRKKHFCKFCQNAVCSDHSAKVRPKEGMREAQRICDLCDQEEEKTVIKGLIDHEVSSLSEELKMAKTTNERLYKDHFEKTATVNQLEEELEIIEKHQASEIENKHLEIDAKKKEKKEKLLFLENLKEQLRLSKLNQLVFQDKSKTFQDLLPDLEEKVKNCKGKTLEVSKEVEKLEKFMEVNFNTEKIIKNLCGRCSGKISENLQRVHLKPVWETEEDKKLD